MIRSVTALGSRARLHPFAIQSSPYKSRWRTRSLATAVAQTPAHDPVELDTITTLSNGIRVASEPLPGHFSAVGIYVDGGSRHETPALSGASHITDRMAFKSTKHRDAASVFERIEMLGGSVQCASSRETVMYQAATFSSAVPDAVSLLAEAVRDPLFTDEEISQQLETADYEIGEIWSNSELILPELLHVAAYQGNTLGNPLLCPQERLPHVNRRTLDLYRQTLYRPERMVIAFAGVEHSQAIHLAEKYFGDMKPNTGLALPELTPTSTPTPEHLPRLSPISPNFSFGTSLSAPNPSSSIFTKPSFFKNLTTSAFRSASVLSPPVPSLETLMPSHQPTQYTGRFLSIPNIPSHLPNVPPLTHIHLALEAPSITSPDIYAVAILHTLLGGGGSFSAGGPGKGMYSRLYTNVLNQNHWVESCITFNHSYSDSALFGISAACMPGSGQQMLQLLCRELRSLTFDTGPLRLQEGEVQRAKNQLRSMLLMNLESRIAQLEDIGRQIQTHGRRIGVKEMCAHIDAVSIRDLRKVATEICSGRVLQNVALGVRGSGAPTVVVREAPQESGKPEFPGGWDEIQDTIKKWGLGAQ